MVRVNHRLFLVLATWVLVSAAAAEFQVNTYTMYDQNHPSIAASSGGFVVVWDSYKQLGTANPFDVFGQRYDSLGNPLGGEFLVNSYTTSHQSAPSIAA